ncbi:MAG: hypothetical protein J6331_06850 [Lentisphaeria bacterium]|nr:hypothetical protein [Lentisphaeria bacterium]
MLLVDDTLKVQRFRRIGGHANGTFEIIYTSRKIFQHGKRFFLDRRTPAGPPQGRKRVPKRKKKEKTFENLHARCILKDLIVTEWTGRRPVRTKITGVSGTVPEEQQKISKELTWSESD